jgi:excisionase family DNA binding protein
MINDRILQRRSGEDRRKKSDRRSGFDRRNVNFANGFDDASEENVYTTKEACEYLKISRPTYLKYIAEGRIRAIKVGRGWRTLKTELDRFLRGD